MTPTNNNRFISSLVFSLLIVCLFVFFFFELLLVLLELVCHRLCETCVILCSIVWSVQCRLTFFLEIQFS